MEEDGSHGVSGAAHRRLRESWFDARTEASLRSRLPVVVNAGLPALPRSLRRRGRDGAAGVLAEPDEDHAATGAGAGVLDGRGAGIHLHALDLLDLEVRVRRR